MSLYQRIITAVSNTAIPELRPSRDYVAGYEAAKQDALLAIGIALLEENQEQLKAIAQR